MQITKELKKVIVTLRENPKHEFSRTRDLIKRNPLYEGLTTQELDFCKTHAFGLAKDTTKTEIEEPKIKTTAMEVDMVERKHKAVLKDLQSKYERLLKNHEVLEDSFNDLLVIKENKKPISVPLTKETKEGRSGASLILVSDWHVEKQIIPSSVNGMNEYNLDIAKQRADKFTDSTIKLINRDAKDFSNHTSVIYLLGDFIEGYLHEHNNTTNYLTPVEATMYAKELLSNSLNTIFSNAKSKDFKVVCKTGNHSRMTKKMNSSIDHRHNYEYMLYQMLSKQFPGVDFNVPESDIGYTDILGYTVRDFHGWQLSYGGGIGGLTIPLTKFIQRQNSVRKADFNVFGHFHQFSKPTKDSMLNSSLCGYDTYAQTIGASYEPAQQGYQLLDSKYGFTISAPIICE